MTENPDSGSSIPFAVTILIAVLFLSGGVLIYDSAVTYVFRLMFGSLDFFGFDLKEFAIGLVLAAGAFFMMRRLLPMHAGSRPWLIGLFFAGLFTPVLFSFEINAPHWFTSRTSVTPAGEGQTESYRYVRSRYLEFADENAPGKNLPETEAALADLLRAEAEAAVQATDDQQAKSQAELQMEAARQMALARAEEETRLAEEAQQQNQPLAETARLVAGSPFRNTYDLVDACGDGRLIDLQSKTLVEYAAGTIDNLRYQPDAENLLNKAIEIDPKNLIAYDRLAHYYMNETGNPAAAVSLLSNALLELPGCASTHFQLASAYTASGDFHEAKRQIEEAIRLTPDPPASYYYNLGNAYLKTNNPAVSAEHYLQALRKDPAHAKARINLTRAYIDLRKTDELLAMYRDDAESLRKIGVTLSREGERLSALLFYERALEIEPHADTYYNAAVDYGQLGHNDKARAAAERALELQPGHGGANQVIDLLDRQ